MEERIREDQKQAVEAWIAIHNPKCPICGRASWEINDHFQGLPTVTGDAASGKVHTENYVVVFSIVCKNCGVLQLFSASQAGAF